MKWCQLILKCIDFSYYFFNNVSIKSSSTNGSGSILKCQNMFAFFMFSAKVNDNVAEIHEVF